MHAANRILVAGAGLFCVAGSALAADLSGDDIKKLISGKSVYLALTTASIAAPGKGVIFYADDGTALYRTAKGAIWHGKWSIKGNTACIDWKEVANNPCSRYDKQGETVSIINIVTGETRAKIESIAAGNPKKLAP